LLTEEDIQALPVVPAVVGVDVGLTEVAVLSTGEKIANPTHRHRSERRLAHAQHTPSGTWRANRKGSKHRDTARLTVARMHARAKAIRAVGWSAFVRQVEYRLEYRLEYTAGWYGRSLVKVDRWYPSSKRCHACGHLLASLTLDVRCWTCPACGVRHDRGINAAKTFLAVGRTVHACGETIRPRRATPDVARPDEAGIPRL
jgi:putative transposase